MATIRLIPSTYQVSSTSYLSVSNGSNMYANTDSTTYATITNTYASTSSRYLYLRGFNFDDIPSTAVVSSFTVKIKGYESGLNTSISYAPRLANGTSALSNTTASSTLTTSTTTITIPHHGLTWEQIKNYGSSFTIMVYVRRSSKNTTGYAYIYGAEIEVTYTIPDPRTITSTMTGDGMISPSGAQIYYDGNEYELTITPTNKSDAVTATKDGVDITNQLVAHGVGDTVTITPNDVTTSGVQSGTSYAEYAVGHSAESPSSSGTSSNMYASSGSTGYAAYSFDFSDIPSGAMIESIEVRCYGHRESNTISSSYVSQCAIYNGSTAISDTVDFSSTNNSIITLEPNSTVTRSQLDSLTVRHYVGYYGGLVLGISFEVTYSTGSGIDHYTYTYTVSGDAAIVVTIGSSSASVLYFKNSSGSWVAVTKAYKKVNAVWVEQADLTMVFDSSTNYVQGD